MTATASLLLALLNRPAVDPDGGPACEVCGCTEDRACPGGCWWVPSPTSDLCSACAALILASHRPAAASCPT